MPRKRWMVAGGVLIVAGVGLALGATRGSAADKPVRIFLVHEAEHPEQGQSSTSMDDGITIFRRARGDQWPTLVVGYLDDIEDDWVIVRKAVGDERQEIHIPRERVQLLEHISEDELKRLVGIR